MIVYLCNAFRINHIVECLVSVIPFSISVYELPRRASAASEKKLLECTRILANVLGENWSLVQNLTQIGWQVSKHIFCQSLFKGGGRAPCAPPLNTPLCYLCIQLGESCVQSNLSPAFRNTTFLT